MKVVATGGIQASMPTINALLRSMEEDRGPAPATHEACTLLVAWARHAGVPDGDLYDLAEGFRTSGIQFFEWNRRPVDLCDGRLTAYGTEEPRCPMRRDAQWDGDHLAIRTPVMPDVMLSSGSIRIDTHLPLSVMAALVGRPLSDLVALPFAVDAVIASVRMDEGMVVEMEPRWTQVAPA